MPHRFLFCWGTAFCAGAAIFLIALHFAPTFDQAHLLKIPKSIEDVQKAAEILGQYAEKNELYSLFLVFLYVVTSMALSFPGKKAVCLDFNFFVTADDSLLKRMLAGALFGLPKAMFIHWAATTTGAVCNYYLAKLCLRDYFATKYADQLKNFRRGFASGNMRKAFWYIASMNLIPFMPSAFISSASALTDVPVEILVAGTAIGSLPLLYVEVSYGVILKDLKSGSVATGQLLSLLLVLALLAALSAYVVENEQGDSTGKMCPLDVAQRQLTDSWRSSKREQECPRLRNDGVIMRVSVPGNRLSNTP